MHYLELTLTKSDKSLYECWSLLFNQVHLSLVHFASLGICTLGVSFVDYRFEQSADKAFAKLGNRLRVFGDSQMLAIFEQDLISRLDNYYPNWQDDIHKKSIKAVPSDCKYAVFERYYKKDIKQIAKNFAKHKNISYEKALHHCQTHKSAPKPYPFILLNSLSSQKSFHLYIKKTLVDKPMAGKFNTYGLSDKASVPEF